MFRWITRTTLAAGTTLPLLGLLTAAQAAPVHQHGRAEAALVVEGDTLTLSFRAPLMDIVGAERPPADADERARYQEQMDKVTAPRPSPAAGCELREEAVTTVAELFPEGQADHDHDHDHDHAGGGHQDLEASWTYQCAHMDRLDAVTWAFLADFPALTTEVILLRPQGQGARRLAPGQTRLTLDDA